MVLTLFTGVFLGISITCILAVIICDKPDDKVKKPLLDAEALDMAIKALEQEPSEDAEVIKVSKGAVKARQGRYVIYDVEWLKKNFYTTEEKIYGQPKEPCEDCISKEAVLNTLDYIDKVLDEERNVEHYKALLKECYEVLPSVTSQQTSTLDKIRAEISCYIIEDDTSGNTPARLRADWAAANKAHLIDIAILDKYKRESEEN